MMQRATLPLLVIVALVMERPARRRAGVGTSRG